MIRPLIVLALCSGIAMCQTFNARITGRIVDVTDAAVPNATVSVVQGGTNVKKTAVSDSGGIYSVPLLLPGTYEVTVEAAGLQSQIRKDVRLEINQVATLDFKLAVAQISTAVEVTDVIPLLQSETSNVGTSLESKLLEQYPLPQRDVMGMIRSLPGIVSGGGVGDARGGRNVFDSNFSVAGGRTSTNEVLLDGAANTIGDFNGVVIVPPVDSVQEFRVETSSYSAEFGRSGGGTVNIVTKSGTNEPHGSLYENFQNTVLNANSFTYNRVGSPRDIVKRNQYGYTLGGPVWIPKLYNGKNKTFFFTTFEGRRERNPMSGLYSVPTAREMSGDFSQSYAAVSGAAKLIQIYDPTTTQMVNGSYVRQPFAGNVIPASRLSSIAQKVLKEYPSANRIGSSITGRQNYYFQNSEKYSRDVFGARVDQYFTEKHRLFGRFNWQQNLRHYPAARVQFGEVASVFDNFRNVGIDDTYQFSPNLNNVFRYSYTRFRANQFPIASLGYDPTTLGLPSYYRDAANILIYPNFSFGDNAGFAAIGGRAYNNQPRDTQSISNQIVWTKGSHNVRVGGEYRLYRFFPFQVFNPTGGFSFGAGMTQQNPLAAVTSTQGMGLASFLLGDGTSFAFEHAEGLTAYHHYVGAYVQDDWKVSSRLTLNLGLRWETETGTAETHDRLTYFDPKGTNPLVASGAPTGAMKFAGGSNPHSIRAANMKDFGPRVGFAFRASENMSVRGGFGIFYVPISLEPGITTTPFGYSVNADIYNTDYTPKVTLADPFPGGIPKSSSASRVDDGSYFLGSTPGSGTVLRDWKAGYMQEWNFGMSRQIGKSMVVDATYYGSHGLHLPAPSMILNQMSASYLAKGSAYLTEQVANPYYGKVTSGLLSKPTVPRMQLLKPFPQFASTSTSDAFGASLLMNRPGIGDSVYHAVTLKLERRFSAGLSISAHYTISKLLDTAGVGNGNAFNDSSAFRDIYNTRLERAVSSWDVPQRLVVNYAYELPFGKGKKLLNGSNLLNRFVGGWTIFSVHTFQSGLPIAVGSADLSRLAGAGPARANVVAGVDPKFSLDQARANARSYDPACNCTKSWFNTAAFASAPAFTMPNGPRNLPTVRQDTLRNWDMSITKKIGIGEHVNMALSGNFFNLLNQVTFGAPNGTVTSNTFGSAGSTSASYGPRRVEIGAKVVF